MRTIIAAVTSNLSGIHQPHQFLIDLTTPDGQLTGLLSDSAVRCERLHSIPQMDVRQIIGRLSPALLSELDRSLKAALDLP